MITRQQYLNKESAHNEYYTQFVTPFILKLVESEFSIDQLKQAFEKDPYFNTIPLEKWDGLSLCLDKARLNLLFRERGDFISQAGLVCILKTAARQLIKDEK